MHHRKRCNPKGKAHRTLKALCALLKRRLAPKSQSISERSEWINHSRGCRKQQHHSRESQELIKARSSQLIISKTKPQPHCPARGRDAPAKPTERGEASPHAPPPTPEPAASHCEPSFWVGSRCAIPLSLRYVRTLPKGRLHCTALTVSAASLGGLSWKICYADVSPSGIRASCT